MEATQVFDLAARSVVALTLTLRGRVENWERRVENFFENLVNILTPAREEDVSQRIRAAQAWLARLVGKWMAGDRRRGIPWLAGNAVYQSLAVIQASSTGEKLVKLVTAYATTCKWLSPLVVRRAERLPIRRARSPRDLERITFQELLKTLLGS